MTDQERRTVESLLARIETSTGAIADRSTNAVLIAEILQAVNGLRSALGLVRAH